VMINMDMPLLLCSTGMWCLFLFLSPLKPNTKGVFGLSPNKPHQKFGMTKPRAWPKFWHGLVVWIIAIALPKFWLNTTTSVWFATKLVWHALTT
jgi:hypothetical protein